MNDELKKGIPVFIDEKQREIINSNEEEQTEYNWFPGNSPAKKLWKCSELLRDILEIVEPIKRNDNAERKKRRTKILSIQLYSLCQQIDKLLKELISDPSWKKLITIEQKKYLPELHVEFHEVIPFDKGSKLKSIRDMLGAHLDKKLTPNEANSMIKEISVREFGFWLQGCLLAIMKLLEFNTYTWSSSDCPKGFIKIMSNEPFLVTIKTKEPVQLCKIEIARSPKYSIAEICQKIFKHYHWMFNKDDNYISSFNWKRLGK